MLSLAGGVAKEPAPNKQNSQPLGAEESQSQSQLGSSQSQSQLGDDGQAEAAKKPTEQSQIVPRGPLESEEAAEAARRFLGFADDFKAKMRELPPKLTKKQLKKTKAKATTTTKKRTVSTKAPAKLKDVLTVRLEPQLGKGAYKNLGIWALIPDNQQVSQPPLLHNMTHVQTDMLKTC